MITLTRRGIAVFALVFAVIGGSFTYAAQHVSVTYVPTLSEARGQWEDWTAPASATCADDVVATLAVDAKFTDAPVPTLTPEQAHRVCTGDLPDAYLYEDGTLLIVDTDHEYADYYTCVLGAPCND